MEIRDGKTIHQSRLHFIYQDILYLLYFASLKIRDFVLLRENWISLSDKGKHCDTFPVYLFYIH